MKGNIMRIIDKTAGLYYVECNGKYWTITDTKSMTSYGAYRWNVTEIGEYDCGYNTGSLKEAKQIVEKYSI
jgi:hypothetical protein